MRAKHIFLGVDMRISHDGLKFHAMKHFKVNIEGMKQGELAVFISADKRRLKTYAWNHVVSYLRSVEYAGPIDIAAIDEIVKSAQKNGRVDYSAALKASLEKRLSARGQLGVEMVGRKANKATAPLKPTLTKPQMSANPPASH